MALSWTTLHILHGNAQTIRPFLTEGDVVRTQNAPWLSVVPGGQEADCGYARMTKTARAISAGDQNTHALVFFCFDEEEFSLTLYADGKKQASLNSHTSWVRFARALALLYADDFPLKAFRLSAQCSSLDEQLHLLEETIGVALYDLPGEKPRIVAKNQTTCLAVSAREDALKKRPNAYALTEVERENWPSAFKTNVLMFEALRAQSLGHEAIALLLSMERRCNLSPSPSARAALHMAERSTLAIYDAEANDVRLVPLPKSAWHAVWLTGSGESVALCFGEDGPGLRYLACLYSGGERWRFAPALKEHQSIECCHVSDNGVITLYTRISPGHDAMIWRVDGETGTLLYSRSVAAAEGLGSLRYVSALQRFVCYSVSLHAFVLLDETLAETGRLPVAQKALRFDMARHDEGVHLWLHGHGPSRLYRFDLSTGVLSSVTLEVPALLTGVSSGGLLLATHETNGGLMVFGADGRLLSRHRMKGRLSGITEENGSLYISETMGLSSSGLLSKEDPDRISVRIWRLQSTLLAQPTIEQPNV